MHCVGGLKLGKMNLIQTVKLLYLGVKTAFIAVVPAESCVNVTALSLVFHSNAVLY